MTDRELMQKALAKMEYMLYHGEWYEPEKIIAALHDRLAQPEQEPMAWFTENYREDKSATTYSKKMSERWLEKGWPVTPLYTAPPPRKPLTDEEIKTAVLDKPVFIAALMSMVDDDVQVVEFIAAINGIARAIEAAHGI